MTELVQTDDLTAAALADSVAAAVAAGVVVREVTTIEEQAAVVRLLSEIWGRSLDNPPVPPELLRAFAKAGNYISAAFVDDEIVGATIGFHSTPEKHALHSHIAGVRPQLAGRSVGFAMKQHQRAWALSRGIEAIEWTFDPLVARNAYFNVMKLRAMPVEYLTNFYGVMPDVINGDDETDRLLVRWSLREPEVVAAASGIAPVVDPQAPGIECVRVPADIERLRTTDLALARQWRLDVRERLGAALAGGGRVVGFDRTAGYLVRTGGAS
ncbi:GNAT family N-acetyltransferase [Microbacterium sp. NPDC019599]|uniref:GNAT family N-acetyltransferase n=1 Tax=Microbacterium sp. NPDC019599 TaxID=3154690 RepID=UPI0033EC419F